MGTTKPRITITLEPRAYEVVRRLAAANGRPMSATVTEFLDVALPPMERLVVVLEQAAAMPQATRDAVRASLSRAEAKLLPAFAAGLAQVDFLIEELAEDACERERGAEGESERRSRGEPVAKRLTPNVVTRGSGLRKQAIKGAKNGRV